MEAPTDDSAGAQGKGGGKGGGKGRAPRTPVGFDIFIRNLLEDTTAEQLWEHFKACGNIISAPRMHLGRGFAWITYDSQQAVSEAINTMNGCNLGTRKIYVHAANKMSAMNSAMSRPVTNTDNELFIGAHLPALCEETVDKLVAPNPDGIYIDGTFGRGGHCRALLKALSPTGRLHAFDMDPEAIQVGKVLMAEDSRFTIHHAPFSTMHEVFKSIGIKSGSVAGVLLDVGISSPQFNDKSRGFRPEADGPLDLRFDTSKGVPASEFLKTVPHADLVKIIDEYGEESGIHNYCQSGHAARRIADVICLARSSGGLPATTKSFAELVATGRGKETSGQVMHPAKMTFQALRIHLNDEFEEMRKGMKAAFKLIGDGGRIGLITWKFSERKIVDEVFGCLEAVRDDAPLLKWYNGQPDASPLPEGPSLENDEVVRPSQRELQRNSRSRQGLLHVLHKGNKPRLTHLEQQAYALPGWADVVDPIGSTKDAGDGDQANTDAPAAAVHEEAEKPSAKRKNLEADEEKKAKKKAKKAKKAKKEAKQAKKEAHVESVKSMELQVEQQKQMLASALETEDFVAAHECKVPLVRAQYSAENWCFVTDDGQQTGCGT